MSAPSHSGRTSTSALSAGAQRVARGRLFALVTATVAAWVAVFVQALPASLPVRASHERAPGLPAVDSACSATRELSAARARVSEVAALAAIDRYPFDAGEGLRALAMLDEAADCARVARQDAQAARLRARCDAWRAHVERDYRDHLTRYRLALAGNRGRRAVIEIEFLLALLDRDGGEFAAHLRHVRDTLAARDARAAETP